MFEYLYDWIQNIAFYMVMVTAVMHVIPNPDYKRYIRFFTGLVLVVMLMSPFLKLMGTKEAWRELYHTDEYLRQIKKMEEAGQYLEDMAIEDDIEAIGEPDMEGSEIHVGEIQIGR